MAAHKGKAAVVVYFYPRDDTPGCTTEACDFRDNMARVTSKPPRLLTASAACLGMSPSSAMASAAAGRIGDVDA